ncbi:MAG: lipopolysaccharide heptosyltransferase II [Candidatus Omnitrophota bacterium]
MKVLQILPELKVGGVETGTVDFAKYLIQHGHEAVVVSSGGDLVADIEAAGVKHYKLPAHRKNLFSIISSIKKLEKIIMDEKVDIVHARSRVPAWIAFFACHKTDTAFITTCHGYYGKHLFSRVMGSSKLVIVPSEVIGRHMIDDFGVRQESIRLIPRSVDLKRFSKPHEEKTGKADRVVAIIGRMTPLKGHAYFLKAMAKVVRSMPYVKIWMIGDAPASKQSYKQELQILIKRLGLHDYVEFLGNRKDVPALLSRIDVLVLSSIEPESFGRVVVEAQAAGVPVVATKVGGVIEIIDDEQTGLLVLPKDTDAMAQAVMRVLKDRRLAQSLVTEARKKIELKYTLEHMASKTLEVYKELLDSLNILVIKISSIGDVVLVIPSLRALRRRYPQALIYCLVGKEASPVLKRCPYINGFIVIDPQENDRGAWRLFRFSRQLRRFRFDKVIDLQNNRRSHMLAFLSFARNSYGYDNGKGSFLLSRRIKNEHPFLPPVEHQFQVLKMLGIEYEGNLSLELWPSIEDEEFVRNLLDSEWMGHEKNIIGIHLAASDKWISKNWPLDHVARLCDILSQKNLRIVVTGVEQDKERARELLNRTKSKPAILVGKTDILQLAVLIRKCKVFITPDSAPMHIAAAMHTPFIALFGPTNPLRHAPPCENPIIFKKEIKCSPCYSPMCRMPSRLCMEEIKPEEVADEVLKLVKMKR